MNNRKTWIGRICVFLIVWLILAGCQAQERGVRVSTTGHKVVSLAIVGYNYTDRYIDTFEVNGAGGGNLYVSSPSSGGGGTTCCVPYMTGLRGIKVTVRWQHGGCLYRTKSTISNDVFERVHHFFKEIEVPVEDLSGPNPSYLEVHFYPDGTVKAAATDDASMPRLKLQDAREDKTPYPRCPRDEKPAN